MSTVKDSPLGLTYCYPTWHTVSFTVIGRKHVEYLRKLKLAKVYELDELNLTWYYPIRREIIVIHPWFYIFSRLLDERYRRISEQGLVETLKRMRRNVDYWKSQFEQMIAVEVADSDRISEMAINLINEASKIIVPSNFVSEVYRRSGARPPIYRIPHGLDPEWYSAPNIFDTGPREKIDMSIVVPYVAKLKMKKRILLYWLWHSAERKGWPEVYELYRRLIKERDDVLLVMKTTAKDVPEVVKLKRELGEMGVIQIFGWLSEYEKMALYDSADITLMFSRGGAFEMSAIESLARGVPVIVSDWCSWTDYVPNFLRAKVGEKVIVLPGNTIHVGYGYKIDVEDALNLAHNILENYDDYKARVEEWRANVLAKEYRWDYVAQRLIDVIGSG
jgi:glycosyltransferase involved in cell wall biosynthesis